MGYWAPKRRLLLYTSISHLIKFDMPGFQNLTSEERSALMARIRKKDTKPELVVRRLTHSMGYRYRLHRPDLPGTPDIVFPARHKVIYVHGCFWHQHDCPLGRKRPTKNPDYWLPKLDRNKIRDKANLEAMTSLGWKTLIIWECETRNSDLVRDRIREFLEKP